MFRMKNGFGGLTMRIAQIFLACFLFVSAEESKKVLAIFDISLQGDASKLFTREERDQLTTIIRREGSRMLGSQLDIWSQGQMQKMITANIATCSESSCLAGFIKSISADYGVQPTVRIAFDKLHLSLEVASDVRTLGSSEIAAPPTKAGKNELGEKASGLAREVFAQLSAELGSTSVQTERIREEPNQEDDVRISRQPSIRNGMVSIPTGCFYMGSKDSTRQDENPLHRVCISEFRMDVTEVTNDDYTRCVSAGKCVAQHYTDGTCFSYNLNSNKWEQVIIDPKFQGSRQPASCVNWPQAKNYCAWAGKRLPTEAEYEYANRAGTTTLYPWGNSVEAACRYGNGADQTLLSTKVHWNDGIHCEDHSGDVTSVVATYEPNNWGLYDMAGNVWEWTADWYGEDYYLESPLQDPQGPSTGKKRSLRGGAWNSLIDGLRSARRYGDGTGVLGPTVGFRCAQDITSKNEN